MNSISLNTFIVFTIFLSTFIFYTNSISTHPILIIISYDGFRYDYFEQNLSPNMDRLRKLGATTAYLKNMFVTKTDPNHFSIATGLYPETHGVIGNNLYDPVLNKTLSYGYDLFHYNDDIDPIWIQNEKAGNGRHSGAMMWPGSEYSYGNISATFIQAINYDVPWKRRVDTVMQWLTHDTTPVNLVMLYIEDPDEHSHAFGPDSNMTSLMIQHVDNITNYIDQQLIKHGLRSIANVIHLSDHGMDSVSPPNFINLTEYLTENVDQAVVKSPNIHVFPEKGKEDIVFNRLNKIAVQNNHFKVYKKEELFDRWYIKNNRRTPPIYVQADLGYGFQDMYENAEFYKDKYGIEITPTTKYGVHGYDNNISSMYPFFMARGPAFRRGVSVPPFENIDLYSLFCEVLNLVPNGHNGTFENVADMLVSRKNQ